MDILPPGRTVSDPHSALTVQKLLYVFHDWQHM